MEQTISKRITLIVFLFVFQLCQAQNIETIYFLPGQGSDHRIFDSLEMDSKLGI